MACGGFFAVRKGMERGTCGRGILFFLLQEIAFL